MTTTLDEKAKNEGLAIESPAAEVVPGTALAERVLQASFDREAEAQPMPQSGDRAPLRRRLRWLHRLMTLVMLLAFVLVGTTVVGQAVGWWRLDVVLSGSMRPTFAPGDLLILKSEPLSNVRVGQILAFVPPGKNYVETHRVIQVQRIKGQTIVRTKGDANNIADPWRAVLDPPKVWYVDHVVPHAGFITEWAKSKGARIGVIAIFVGLFLVYAIGRIWRRQDPPEDEDDPQRADCAHDEDDPAERAELEMVGGREPC